MITIVALLLAGTAFGAWWLPRRLRLERRRWAAYLYARRLLLQIQKVVQAYVKMGEEMGKLAVAFAKILR